MVSERETRCRTQGKMINVCNKLVLKRNYGDIYTSNNDTERYLKKYIIMVGVNWLSLGSSSGLL